MESGRTDRACVHIAPLSKIDLRVALNWDNLILLCKPCHMAEHNQKRWRADDMTGHVEI